MLGPASDRPVRLIWTAIPPLLLAAGGLVAISPQAGLAIGAGVIGVLIVAQGVLSVRIFLAALFGLLVGYAFMGRGFAYLGMPPIFVGEVVLALGILGLVAVGPARRIKPPHMVILAFMLWGAVGTVPYIGTYGTEAMRDGVAWGYAAFALVVSLTVRRNHLRWLVRAYGRAMPLLLAWIPLFAAAWITNRALFPIVPGTEVQIPFFKPGDLAVHLAASGAFMLVGLYRHSSWRPLTEPLLWALWLAGFGAVAALNRGGMLAIILGMGAVLAFLRSFERWFAILATAAILLVVLTVTGVEFDTGTGRSISVAQLAENVDSVLGEAEDPNLVGTREWREEWWSEIIAYTFGGPHFWDGKGYGLNLAEDDGFVGHDFPALRAPHNAHLQFLARGGVPGLALWIAVQLTFVVVVGKSAYRCARAHRRWWLGVHAWIAVYWLAALVNMTFDVYLEGPQGGILFWSTIGLGLSLPALAQSDAAAHDRPSRTSSPDRWRS